MASKRRLRRDEQRRACYRKCRHTQEHFANIARSVYFRDFGDWLIVYRCRFCAGWHVGHYSEAVRERIGK